MNAHIIAEAALESGIRVAPLSGIVDPAYVYMHELTRFSQIIAAHERERIAKIFEDDGWPPYDYPEVAAAIRSMGDA